jgi:hypothetical protein
MVIMDHSLLEWPGIAGTYRTADGQVVVPVLNDLHLSIVGLTMQT